MEALSVRALLTAILPFLLTCHCTCAAPSSAVPEDLRAELPSDWRERLTDTVYNYHVNRPVNFASNKRFEGDIAGLESNDERRRVGTMANGVVDANLLWPDKILPYEIAGGFSEGEKELIRDSLADMQAKTCLIIRPRNSRDRNYVTFSRRESGCWSWVGRLGGAQAINLAPGCVDTMGAVQHEVMHAIGFFHEQSRLDRDENILVIWSNVQGGKANTNFQKRLGTNAQGVPYDYDSIMHYAFNEFARNPKYPTLVPIQSAQFGRKNLGSRVIMSAGDVEKINRLYKCPEDTRQAQTQGTEPQSSTERPASRFHHTFRTVTWGAEANDVTMGPQYNF
ncbi:putative Zinc metalloproteinase nas-15 [Hypsibius exemplaris]|uniref:Metalloendopeptidase n=1 Tax=Hypsibius exemplaris TaxID=2072580 RepID=A0A1W0WCD5_HYPEX|nr:putative Zinc metalloproteinase nas-15 [Hypsibius exemplaris]